MKWYIRLGILLAQCLILLGCTAGKADEYDLKIQRIREDTIYLCREIGIRVTGREQERQAADWIEKSLCLAGFTKDEHLVRTDFTGMDNSSENVVAVCNGDSTGSIYVILAHYDSVSTSPGARDNAASVAALMEIARYLGPENAEYPCQIRMVFAGSEENGYHGSRAYVESLTEEERKRHRGVFNMDISAASDGEEAQLVCNTLGAVMEGEYREGNFIIPAEGALTAAIGQSYQKLYGKKLGGVFHFGESDHVSFHNAGIEAVNVCWRKILADSPVLPVSYHKMEDTPEELNYETVLASARCVLSAIHTLAESGK